jgi:hypothetical protein
MEDRAANYLDCGFFIESQRVVEGNDIEGVS